MNFISKLGLFCLYMFLMYVSTVVGCPRWDTSYYWWITSFVYFV